MRVTGQNENLMSALSQISREAGRVRGDSSRLGRIIDPEDHDFHRSMEHRLERSGNSDACGQLQPIAFVDGER